MLPNYGICVKVERYVTRSIFHQRGVWRSETLKCTHKPFNYKTKNITRRQQTYTFSVQNAKTRMFGCTYHESHKPSRTLKVLETYRTRNSENRYFKSVRCLNQPVQIGSSSEPRKKFKNRIEAFEIKITNVLLYT